MRLAPAGDLHRLGEAADIADVDAVELVDVALDVGQELPLARRIPRRWRTARRSCGAAPRRLPASRRGSAPRGNRACPSGIFWQKLAASATREAVVVVDAEHDVVAQFLARLDAPWRRRGDRLARLVDGRGCRGRPGDRRMAFQPCVDQHLGLLDHLGAGLGVGGGEGRDAVAMLAAEQLVDRHAERLALDVVQGDVDRRDRRRAARGRPRNTGCDTSPATARRCASGRGRSGTRDSARWRRPPPSRGRTARFRPSRTRPRRSRP